MIHNLHNLSENSLSYGKSANIYELFSQAEDYPQLVLQELIQLTSNKTVADIGCGNGKYVYLLQPWVKTILGMDKSIEQLKIAKNYSIINQALFFQCDATQIALPNNSQDIVLSCWMLGTILDQDRQETALNEMKRICKDKIILVENNIGSQFELLRGRDPNIDQRTYLYNQWLIDQGFTLYKTVHSYFQFENKQVAQFVFSSIWKDRLTQAINDKKINHSINIYIYNHQK